MGLKTAAARLLKKAFVEVMLVPITLAKIKPSLFVELIVSTPFEATLKKVKLDGSKANLKEDVPIIIAVELLSVVGKGAKTVQFTSPGEQVGLLVSPGANGVAGKMASAGDKQKNVKIKPKKTENMPRALKNILFFKIKINCNFIYVYLKFFLKK